jgi:Putative binding domain, N-terminal/Viral BACON domain
VSSCTSVVRLRRAVLPAATLAMVAVLAGSCHNTSPNQPTCTFTVSPSSLSAEAAGGSTTVSVSTTSGCAWTAQAGAGWLSITSGASGTGSGTVAVAVAANAATSPRTGTLTVAGQTVTVTQAAAAVVCTYAVSPTSVSFTKDGGSGSVTVTAPDTCAWTAASGVSWLTITAGSQGSGNGTVSYTVAGQNDPAGRETILTVAGTAVSVSQSGDVGSCQYSVSPVTFSPCMTSPALTATITTATACPWTASPSESWITLTSGGSGTGPGVIGFTVSSNYDAPRLGLVMVRWPTPTAGQNLQVAQAGCHYGVSTSALSFAKAGGAGSFMVLQQSDPYECGGALQDQCVWSALASVPWITITTSMPRKGDDTVFFTVAVNPDSASRTGTITVRDQTVTITQGG